MILEKKNKRSDAFTTSPNKANLEVEFERRDIQYEDLSGRFKCSEKDFNRQFAHIYAGRLLKMKDALTKACSMKWGQKIPIRKLSELSDETNEECIVIGTLFKHQELKPSILKEISEENQVLPQPPRSNYVSDGDQLVLEDEIQRIRLMGSFDVKKFVTGVVVGILGFENQEGKFVVKDMCFAGIEKYLERPVTFPEDSFIIMISGLDVSNAKSLFALELLIDSIKGNLGSVCDQEMWSKVCRVLIAGNSVSISNASSHHDTAVLEPQEGRNTIKTVKQLDSLLVDLVRSVEVDLMPGEFDPSNHFLPQQAIFSCVFPKASQYESFHSVTNPYDCRLGGRRILGSSGQPVNDIKSLTDINDSCEILEKTLHWGHLAPTAPDTLACYPYYKNDPFIIFEQPDIYFAGNQNEYKSKWTDLNGHQTRIISIPSFSKMQTCVSVNLQTLECTPIILST